MMMIDRKFYHALYDDNDDYDYDDIYETNHHHRYHQHPHHRHLLTPTLADTEERKCGE